MQINYSEVRRIIDRFQALDAYEAYYVKDEVRMQLAGAVVPETTDVLRRAFAQSARVLDIGCGDGRTLLSNAGLFGQGTGVDESEDRMIRAAIRARDAKGIQNVDFRAAKGSSLPFFEGAFDMVFSERGPLGHSDGPLAEALRVLRSDGLIFVETLGDYQALGTERERFLRLGVRIQTLTARTQTLVFRDFYDYLTYRCSVWVYCGAALPSPADTRLFDALLAGATDDSGRISIVEHTIWIAGSKAEEPGHAGHVGAPLA